MQGNGRWKHFRCNCALVLRRVLALVCHHSHARRVPNRIPTRGCGSQCLRRRVRPLFDGQLASSPVIHPSVDSLFLQGWFIFTTLLLFCTLRSTVAFFSLFFSLDMAFLLLGIGYLHRDAAGMPNPPVIKAGGFFALLAAFLAWYNALAGIADDSNRQALPSVIFSTQMDPGLTDLALASSSSPWHISPGPSRQCNRKANWTQTAARWLRILLCVRGCSTWCFVGGMNMFTFNAPFLSGGDLIDMQRGREFSLVESGWEIRSCHCSFYLYNFLPFCHESRPSCSCNILLLFPRENGHTYLLTYLPTYLHTYLTWKPLTIAGRSKRASIAVHGCPVLRTRSLETEEMGRPANGMCINLSKLYTSEQATLGFIFPFFIIR